MIKEFLALLKDKRSRMVIFVPPILQLLVFGYAATFDLNRIPFAVYNEDAGPASRDLVARFAGSPNFQQVATVTHEDGNRAAGGRQTRAAGAAYRADRSAAICSAAARPRCR